MPIVHHHTPTHANIASSPRMTSRMDYEQYLSRTYPNDHSPLLFTSSEVLCSVFPVSALMPLSLTHLRSVAVKHPAGRCLPRRRGDCRVSQRYQSPEHEEMWNLQTVTISPFGPSVPSLNDIQIYEDDDDSFSHPTNSVPPIDIARSPRHIANTVRICHPFFLRYFKQFLPIASTPGTRACSSIQRASTRPHSATEAVQAAHL